MRTKAYYNSPRIQSQKPIVTQKYKQFMLNCLKCGSEPNGTLTRARLANMLYLSDFAWYYLYASRLSGADYRKQQNGPLSDIFSAALRALEEDGFIADKRAGNAFHLFLARCNIPADRLSMDELRLIESIGRAWRNKSDSEIADFVRGQLPYQVSRESEIIPYELISQEEPLRACGMADI
jgi:hypothetical protein